MYKIWETLGLNKAPKAGTPFTILMPPPNANASLHAGHGMYTIDDLLTRYKRLMGFSSVWIPGMDHAGFETQFVYEKHLKKEGKSRLDFDRQTLYDNVFKFVKENSGLIYAQFKQMGFLADWDKSVFTLDDHVIDYVYQTFEKMVADGYVYRGEHIVNYCTYCGTSLADLEVEYEERVDSLYYIRYQCVDGMYQGKDYIIVATGRPEVIYVDTHLAVHPDNLKTKELIGKKVINPQTGAEMEIIADTFVDPEFGTGVVKLTPAHDPHDFVVAKKYGLPIIKAIDLRGKMMGGKYAGMKVGVAREQSVKDLTESDSVEKINSNYEHSVQTCYKCKRILEPLTIPNWFIKVEKLKSRVIDAVKKDEVKFHPSKFKKQMLDWLQVMHDWPISRQIVWGIRIPVWYKIDKDQKDISVSWIDKSGEAHFGSIEEFVAKGVKISDIRDGLQTLSVQVGENATDYVISKELPGDDYLPETNTFDTWFSSGQWPLVTIKNDDLETRFPTDFMGTLHEILKFWVSRMIMFSLYRNNKVPFKNVYLWSMVTDGKGQKMSKSKGNVVNPITYVEKYGADAFRGALLFGVAQGGKVAMSEDKVRAMRNYANKVWNIGRFINMNKKDQLRVTSNELRVETNANNTYHDTRTTTQAGSQKILEELKTEFTQVKAKYIKDMDSFKFSRAFDDLYEFVWHRFADHYIEALKQEIQSGQNDVLASLESVFITCIKMLHPFMPFVTEAIWQEFGEAKGSILESQINTD